MLAQSIDAHKRIFEHTARETHRATGVRLAWENTTGEKIATYDASAGGAPADEQAGGKRKKKQ